MMSHAFAPFLGSAFLAFLMAYMLFNLSKSKQESQEGDGLLVTREVAQHKFLQLILIGVLILSLLINGYSVLDMGLSPCEWMVVNSTDVSASVTTYDFDYECTVVSNPAAENYLKLMLWSARLIGAYVILYFLFMLREGIKRAREDYLRRRGR